MKSKIGQIGMEFIIVMGALTFFLAIFLSVVQQNTEEKIYSKESLIVKEIATTVQKEISLAKESMDGYSRDFEIPRRAGNLEYEINISSESIYIITKNGKHALSLPTEDIIGNINITDNTIKKINGEIYLNQ